MISHLIIKKIVHTVTLPVLIFSNIAVNLLTLCCGTPAASGVNCLALSVLPAASGVKFLEIGSLSVDLLQALVVNILAICGLPVAPPGGRCAKKMSVRI